MISTDSNKFHSRQNSIQSTVHQSLQIRTNKHRCFVFCIGHTSLTCVPGIGKKNKYLLNQSGIHDLSTLYSKYRSINNIQHFKQWLENDIGFTSYQAKMTTCGIGTKLGEIKEISTGLIPICCPPRERREEKYRLLSNDRNIKKRNRSNQSKNEKNKEEGIKKQKIEDIKLENTSPSSNQDQREPKHESQKSFNIPNTSLVSSSINNLINKKEPVLSPIDGQTSDSFDEKLINKLSDNYLTGVKSPDNPLFAIRPLSVKDNAESNLSSNPNKFSFDRKHEANEISETKLIKSKSSSPASELSKLNQTPNNIHEILPTSELSYTSPRIDSKMLKSESNSDQQKKNEIQPKKSSIIHNSISQQVDSTPSSELSMKKKLKSEGSLTDSNVISQHFTSSQDAITNHQPIIFPQLSTNDVNLDTDKKESPDIRSKFQDEIDKEIHQLPSLHASRKDTDDDQTEQESTSLSNLDDLPVGKSFINKRASHEIFNDQTTTYSPSISPLNDKAAKLNPIKDEKLNEIFTLTKQKLQPTLDALQDKKDELLSASKNSPDSPLLNEHSKKSILRSTQTKTVSPVNPDVLLADIKQQQRQTQNKPFKTISSPETDQIKPIVNTDINSDIKSKLEEGSPNETDNKSISSIERSSASLPLSTPAVFTIKTSENNLTPKSDRQTSLDPEINMTNVTSPASHSSISQTAEKDDFKQHDKLTSRSISDTNTQKITSPQFSDKLTPSLISEEKGQKSISNQLDSSFNESQQEKLQKEINKTVSQIMKQAANIVSEDIQSPHVNSKSSTKVNLTESSSIQTPLFGMKSDTDTVQNGTLQSKYIPLSERLTQAQAKQLVAGMESNNRDGSIEPFEEDRPIQKKLFPFTSERLKQLSTKTSLHQISNENLKLAQGYTCTSSVPTTRKNDSLTNLASLSDSNQSINRVNSSIDKIQSNSTTNINSFPTEHDEQPSFISTTLSNYLKNDKSYTPIMPSNRINQFINKNLSETINSKENSEKIFDNRKLKINPTTTDSKYQSISSPSCPIPCRALWDNISNEKILSQRKTHRFTLIRKNQSDQKINQNDYNQNRHSSTTLSTFLTRQQYLKKIKSIE